MKKLALSVAMLSLLAACATTKPTEAPVVDKTNAPAPATAPAASSATTAPATAAATPAADPLHDPNNILSQRSIYFDFDQYSVKDQYRPLVSAHADYLIHHADRKVTLQGNTDERGSREYNLALGQKRADAVRQMMSVLGVPANQMETVSFGKEKPKALGHDEGSWAQNRRVDIVYDGE